VVRCRARHAGPQISHWPNRFVPPSTKTSREEGTSSPKKLPIRDGEFEYRIKSINEPFDRVVRESELRNVGD